MKLDLFIPPHSDGENAKSKRMGWGGSGVEWGGIGEKCGRRRNVKNERME